MESANQLPAEFEQEEDPSSRSFFSEIISSISDVRFSHDGRYILSRDYLTGKIWDVNQERMPLKTIPIHEHLRPRLCDTYENDSIFDKFEVVFSGDAKNVMTGSYNNNFMIYPSDPERWCCRPTNRRSRRRRLAYLPRLTRRQALRTAPGGEAARGQTAQRAEGRAAGCERKQMRTRLTSIRRFCT